MIITWSAPDNGGTDITEYVVLIRQNNGIYYTRDMDNCPGTDLTTLYHEICTIPIATLRTDPYNLDWATNVHVKIQAITLKGSSPFSEIGSGAEILDTPDAPQSFLNNLS